MCYILRQRITCTFKFANKVPICHLIPQRQRRIQSVHSTLEGKKTVNVFLFPIMLWCETSSLNWCPVKCLQWMPWINVATNLVFFYCRELIIIIFFTLASQLRINSYFQCYMWQQCHTLLDQTASDRWRTHTETQGHHFTRMLSLVKYSTFSLLWIEGKLWNTDER
jgi:hypothetical protein